MLIDPKYAERDTREVDAREFSEAIQKGEIERGRVVVLGRAPLGKWQEIATYWEGRLTYNEAGTRVSVPYPSRAEVMALAREAKEDGKFPNIRWAKASLHVVPFEEDEEREEELNPRV